MNTPYRCNCIVWAFAQKWRSGGRIRWRRSTNARFLPHALWSPDGVHWYSYSPIAPRHGLSVLSHGLWFRGKIFLDKPQ